MSIGAYDFSLHLSLQRVWFDCRLVVDTQPNRPQLNIVKTGVALTRVIIQSQILKLDNHWLDIKYGYLEPVTILLCVNKLCSEIVRVEKMSDHRHQ